MEWWRKPAHETHLTRAADLRPSVSEICPLLFIGEYPRPADVAWLKRSFKVTAVHNLQDDEDLRAHGLDIRTIRAACDENGIKLLRTPISDGSADAMATRLKQALTDLRRLLSAKERVYLHCNAGLNRAPTLAIAYLRAYKGMSLDEAVAHVKKRRACGPFMTVLEDYFGPRDLKPER